MIREKYSKIVRDRILLTKSLTGGLNIALILLALNLLSINLAIVESSFMLLITVYLLIGVILFNLPFKKLGSILRRKNKEKTSSFQIIVGILLIIFSFILLIATKIQLLWLVSIPILISGLNLILQAIKKNRKELHLLSVASFVYVIFYMLVQSIPILWYSIQQFSLSVSSAIGSLIGKSILLGPSTSGLWIVIIFFIFSCCVFFLTGLKKKYFALNIIGLAICWIIYLGIMGFIEFESNSDIINLHYVLFLLSLVPSFLYLMKSKLRHETLEIQMFKKSKQKRLIRNGTVWALVLLLVFGVVLTVFPGADNTDTNAAKKNIMVYGHNMLGSLDVPEYGKYGKVASGMFGLVSYYLNNSGYNSRIVVEDKVEFLNYTFPIHENITRYVNLTNFTTIIESSTITSDLLTNVDIFVVINLNESFSSSEHEIIWSFVENGGSLLVLGDHTDIGGMMKPLNDLLEPVGISFRFDSALPIDHKFRWVPSYHLMHHPVTYKIDSLDEIEISVGASLDISPGISPFLIGRYGLSDWGDRDNEEGAFLGDYQYNPGEQIGDIILAAGAYYGNGKVIVFGDTSSYQNSAIPYSLPLIQSVFAWLSSQRTAILEYTQIVISLLLLVGAAMLYLKAKKSKIHFAFFPLALCIALIISVAINPIMLGEDEIKGNLVYIDTTHGERFSFKPYEDDSLSGLMLNLMRNNYLPIILREFSKDKIENSEILVFNAPTKPFNDGEVDFIKQFMHDGGLVILSTGFPDKDASMPLLREFELDIYDIPLGPVPYVEEDPEEYQKEPRFVDSWPIIGDIGEDENDTTYPFYGIDIGGYEYILMTFTQYGDGGLLLISDSEFLLDQNLESLYDYWPGNIQFLKNIIDEMITREVLQ